ncbi:MAG: hypothetical protein CL902_00685 [Dehalococcoidia bacterium]|nr:hypothetical protein [Dehalococcoidia bacterium]
MHEPLAAVDALDLVLQIKETWNLNKLFRYYRVQHQNQTEEQGLDHNANIGQLAVSCVDKEIAETHLRALVGELLLASRQGTSLPDQGSPDSTTQASTATSSSSRGDWKVGLGLDDLYGTGVAAGTTAAADTQINSGSATTTDDSGAVDNTAKQSQTFADTVETTAAYDLVDALALGIAFAWTQAGSPKTNAADRLTCFRQAQAFRAQIADEQITHDVQVFANQTTPQDNTAVTGFRAGATEAGRSALLSALDNMIYEDDSGDAVTDTTSSDFHNVANSQKVDLVSQGAGWLSFLAARIVAHSMRESMSNLAERRMVVFGGSDSGAPGMVNAVSTSNITEITDFDTNVNVAGAEELSEQDNMTDRFASGASATHAAATSTAAALKYIDANPGTGAAAQISRISCTVGESSANGVTDGHEYSSNDAPPATYAGDEVRMMPALQSGDNICLAFTFRVTNSATNANTYSAKVGILLTQGAKGAFNVDSSTGVAEMAAVPTGDAFYNDTA